MHQRGYAGFGFSTLRAIVRHRRLRLFPVRGTSPDTPRDIAWIHPHSEAHNRLERFMDSAPDDGDRAAPRP